MARSAKPGEKKGRRRKPAPPSPAAVAGAFVARNPAAVAGSTGLLVAVCYVSANALWYQPFPHRGAFFATRPAPVFERASRSEPETTIRIERPQSDPPPAVADPKVGEVQQVLQRLGFYEGKVDGLPGPATSRAVQQYRRTVGLPPEGGIDAVLLEQLGSAPTTSGIGPIPAPRASVVPQASAPLPPSPGDMEQTRKIQAALKDFGNDGIVADGVAGARTETAIREFQGLFGLPQTGKPDATVYAKMREIGLIP